MQSKLVEKNQIEDEIIKFGKKFIDDNIMRDEIKRNVKKFVNKNIGLKPLTYVEIVRIQNIISYANKI